jgi:hypothetical protein
VNKQNEERVLNNNQLTSGINNSLNWLIKLIKLKKRGHVIATDRAKTRFVQPLGDGQSDFFPEQGKHPHMNPLFTLTRKLWEDKDSKIRMIACSFPFASKEGMPFNLTEYEDGDQRSVLIEITFVLKHAKQEHLAFARLKNVSGLYWIVELKK